LSALVARSVAVFAPDGHRSDLGDSVLKCGGGGEAPPAIAASGATDEPASIRS
jgi:hypothetical protein